MRPVMDQIEEQWNVIFTRSLMTLELPNVSHYLGCDVPPLDCGRSFPDDLETVDYEPLKNILGELDRSEDSL